MWPHSYRSAVLHHGVLHLVTLGNAAGEEAALANVIVEMFQAPVSAEREIEGREKKNKGREGGMGGGRRESITERFTALFSPQQ